jgi:PhnB protein
MSTPPFNGISPYLCVDSGVKALEFYEKAFNGKVLAKNVTDNGMLMHGALDINGGVVMLSDDMRGGQGIWRAPKGATGTVVHIETAHADPWWDRAIHPGCTVVMPLEKQFWGVKYGQLADPFGHIWSIAGPAR